MTITLYYDAASGAARSILVFLDFIKDTTIIRQPVSLHDNEQLKPEFIEMNPFHTVPTLKDDESGLVLYESIAILQYLCDKLKVTGKFGLPTEEKEKWQVFNALHNQPHFMGKTLNDFMDPFYGAFFTGQQLNVETLRAGIEAAKPKYTTFEAILKKNGGFVAGSTPTVADIRTWMDVFQVSNLGGQGTLDVIDFSKEFPEIQKWLLALKEELFTEEAWAASAVFYGMAETAFGGPIFRFATH